MNLFVTPGMGSLMAGRIFAGLGQLGVAVVGFALVVVWFVKLMVQYRGLIDGQEAAFQLNAWLAISGAMIFAISWLWALVTSIGLMQEARRNESAQTNPNGQSQSGAGLS